MARIIRPPAAMHSPTFCWARLAPTPTAPVGAFAAPIYSRDWGMYAQDTWQATPRLTLIYGLRYEYQSPWLYRTQQVTTFDMQRDKLVLPEDSPTPVLPAGADPGSLRGLSVRDHAEHRSAHALYSARSHQLSAAARLRLSSARAHGYPWRFRHLLQLPARLRRIARRRLQSALAALHQPELLQQASRQADDSFSS